MSAASLHDLDDFGTCVQGETLEQQFGEQEVCFRTLDLYTSAVLESTLNPVVHPKEEFRTAMDEMAKVCTACPHLCVTYSSRLSSISLSHNTFHAAGHTLQRRVMCCVALIISPALSNLSCAVAAGISGCISACS